MGVKERGASPSAGQDEFMEEFIDDELEDFDMEDEDESFDDYEEEKKKSKPKTVPYEVFRRKVEKSNTLEKTLNAFLASQAKTNNQAEESDDLDELEDNAVKDVFKRKFAKTQNQFQARIKALEEHIERQERLLINPELRENMAAIERMKKHYKQKTGVLLPDEVLLELVKKKKPREEDVEQNGFNSHKAPASKKVPTQTGGTPNKGVSRKEQEREKALANFTF